MTMPIEATLVGESRVMVNLRSVIQRAAPTDLPVLIEGPTGAGKELVAQALHAFGGRRGHFVAFNVCAVSDTMFEDAFFGHVRGAFTGAEADRQGFLREAHNGSVFLDEITGLALPLQAKLLRALETGRFRPVGATRDAQSTARVIAATNEPMPVLLEARRFRPDLAHRLMAAVIRVPGLNERREDIPLLVRHFLGHSRGTSCEVTAEAVQQLSDHDWTGNVRELKQVVSWAAVLGNGQITGDIIHAILAGRGVSRAGVDGARDGIGMDTAQQADRHALTKVLERHGWRAERAAEDLGVSRATVYRWMKQLGVEPAAKRPRVMSREFAKTYETTRDAGSMVDVTTRGWSTQ